MSNYGKEWANSPYPIPVGVPAESALRVAKWLSLPPNMGSAKFKVMKPNGTSHIIHVKGHARQVLTGLMQRPIYCASIARVSHFVNILRTEKRVDIHTERYQNDVETNRATYGIFYLVDHVEMIKRGGKDG